LPRLAGFATIASTGTLFAALAQATPEATGAALYYLIHSTLAGGLLFLTADLARQGARGPVALLVMTGAIAAVGLPPLSGFPAKLMVLLAIQDEAMTLYWPAMLASSFLLLLAFSRTGSDLCWKLEPQGPAPGPLRLVPAFGLLALLAGLTLGAGPVMRWLDATAQSLHDPSAYIAANRLGEE
jgi:multicomponent K+:H+ antiporter subunit D